MVKRINKERCCIYYIGFVHSVCIGFMVLCGLYLRTYITRANNVIIKIDKLIDDVSFIPYEASLLLNKGDNLYEYIYDVLDNSSYILKHTQKQVLTQFESMDETNEFVTSIGYRINNTIGKFEKSLDCI